MHLFITDGAGTEKTVLINALCQGLICCHARPGNDYQNMVFLIAFTGMAASHISGSTVHYALEIRRQTEDSNAMLETSNSSL